jgi:DNA-binding NtrC family response regulator
LFLVTSLLTNKSVCKYSHPLGEPRLVYTVLFVDDQPGIRKLVKTILERDAEFSVLLAESAEIALEILERVQVDALVTDIVMPGMGGARLVQEVRRRLPDLPVCCVTAHAEHLSADVLRQVPIIRKPFLPTELVDTLHRRLNLRPGRP